MGLVGVSLAMAKRQYSPRKASKALGLKVRALRAERGWTLEDAESHGWASWTHLQKVESGKNITFHTLIRLANLFGIHPSKLLETI